MFKLPPRSKSAPKLSCEFTKHKIYDEQEQLEDGIFIYEHPLHSYKQYLDKYASNNFELLRTQPDFKKAVRKIRPYYKLRIRS